MENAPGIKQAMPSIKRAANNAREQINVLLKITDELEDRLSSVISAAKPISAPASPAIEGSSEFFGDLVTINSLLDTVTNRLIHLLGRLEI